MIAALKTDYKYVLHAPIGRGTFSRTQKGEIAGQGKPVILKTLAASLGDRADGDRLKEQFHSLASRLAHCQHSHLPAVLDLFEEDNFPYIVWEAIPGKTLAEILEFDLVVPEKQAIAYIRQVGQAVEALHRDGLYHLDISPRHIIRRSDVEQVVLVEFGLTSELTPGIEQTHANLLSPGYAAPEQYQPSSPCTPATDVYGLAATLYCLLTGNPPLPAPLRDRIAPEAWQQFPPQLSPAVKAAIVRGLEPTPKNRPQTVEFWLGLLNPPQPPPTRHQSQSPAAQPQPETKIQDKVPVSSPPKPKSKENHRKTQPQFSMSHPSASLSSRPKFPLGILLTICAIAASAGAGFGLSLRLNRPNEAGSTLWHLKQSFPPRERGESPSKPESER